VFTAVLAAPHARPVHIRRLCRPPDLAVRAIASFDSVGCGDKNNAMHSYAPTPKTLAAAILVPPLHVPECGL